MVCFKTKAREVKWCTRTNKVVVGALHFGGEAGVVIRITDRHIASAKIWRVLVFVAEEFLSFLLVGGAHAKTNRGGPVLRT